MKPGARIRAVLDLLPTVLGDTKAPADKQLADWFRTHRYAGSKDRQAIAGCVYGILRTLAQLDWWINRLEGCPIVQGQDCPNTPHHDTPQHNNQSLNRARVIAHQIFNHATPLTLLEQDFFTGDSYTPAVLTPCEKRLAVALLAEQAMTHPQQPPHVQGNFPEFLTADLMSAYGDHTVAQTRAMMQEAPVDIRINTLLATKQDVITALHADTIAVQPCPLAPHGLRLCKRYPLANTRAFRQGWFEMQDEGSQLIANLVGAKPKHRVVDFCAGAGGKTLALAAHMHNKGRIVACDISQHRLKRAGQRLRRAKVFMVERRLLSSERDKWVKRQAVTNGATDPPNSGGHYQDFGAKSFGAKDFGGKGFDRVLVDAPCSGTGTWRRNPDHKWRLTAQDVHELVTVQQSILQSAARLVKPGGRLIYATCSILPRENQGQIDTFLKTFRQFFLVPIPTVWHQENPNPCPTQGDTLQLTPHSHGTDGFFVAVLERKLV